MKHFALLAVSVLLFVVSVQPAQAVQKNLLTIEQAEKSFTGKVSGRRSRGRAGLSAYTRRFRNPGNTDRANPRRERRQSGRYSPFKTAGKGLNKFGLRSFVTGATAAQKRSEYRDYYKRPRFSRR